MTTDAVLLLADLADSTRVNERLGDQPAADLWARHDRFARDQIACWHGREIDKSDGFLLLFTTVADAARFALAYQRGLPALHADLRARIAIHAGPVALRVNHADDVARGAKPVELDGRAKAVAARTMSIALPGQILLTASAKAADDAAARASDQPPHGALLSHGHWRMKGVDAPLELFQLLDDGAPCDCPPDSDKGYRVHRRDDQWHPRADIRHSLPAEADAFVGREALIARMLQTFDGGAHVITLVGPAGVGKTRVAQHVGWSALGGFPGGVWFCDLAQARTRDGVFHAVATGLEIALGADDPALQIGELLATRGRCLVVFDNFEQVSEHAMASVARWSRRAPELRCLVTSRQTLGLPGETVFDVEPLSTAAGCDLFRLRAKAARDDLVLTPDDERAMQRLVALLDGLPLAIELAAVRVRLFPIAKIVERMNERFRLLATKGARDGRHAALRAALDWSWELLAPGERFVLAQLAVFDGGFSVDTAERIVSLDGLDDDGWIPDLIQSLVDKSLVRRVSAERFGLLLGIRDYAMERLEQWPARAGDDATPLRAACHRHAHHFATLSEIEAVRDRGVELDNFLAASRHAAAAGSFDDATQALVNAWAILRMTGPFGSGIEAARRLEATPGFPSRHRAVTRWVMGCVEDCLGRTAEAEIAFTESLEAARAAGDRRVEATIHWSFAELRTNQGKRNLAAHDYATSLALASEHADVPLQLKVLSSQGVLAMRLGRNERALNDYRRALDLAERLGDVRRRGGLLGNIAVVQYNVGRLDDARASYEKALAIAESAGDKKWEGNTRCNLGLLLYELDALDAAQEQYRSALRLARELGHARLECVLQINMGLLAEARGDFESARREHERALELAQRFDDAGLMNQIHIYLAWAHFRGGHIERAKQQLAAARHVQGPEGDPATRSILSCLQACLAASSGRADEARRHLDAAEAHLSVGKRTTARHSDVERAHRHARACVSAMQG